MTKSEAQRCISITNLDNALCGVASPIVLYFNSDLENELEQRCWLPTQPNEN